MENLDNFQIFTNIAMTGNLYSSPINASEYTLVDLQAVWTGIPVGTLYVETSNDVGTIKPDGSISGLVNWTTYSGSTKPLAAQPEILPGTSGLLALSGVVCRTYLAQVPGF